MAWWTKAYDGKIEKHDGPRPKLSAMIRLNFARTMGNQPIEDLGLYRRDPEKHKDEPNLLPEMIRKAEVKSAADQIKRIMGGGKRRRS